MNEVEEDEVGLSNDELEKLQGILENYLRGKTYDDNSSPQLINDILEDVMLALHNYNKPYKYITNLMLSQRMGTSLSNYTASYWDKQYDSVYHIFYPKDKSFTTGGKDRHLIFGLLTISCISYSTIDSKIN